MNEPEHVCDHTPSVRATFRPRSLQLLGSVYRAVEWHRWVGQAFWATIDQVLYGCSGFLLQVLLARWFSEECFGGFNVAFASFLLLLALYNAVLVEPMLVFGSGDYRSRFTDYIGVLFFVHIGLAVVASLVLFGVSIVFAVGENHLIGRAFLGAAGATPFVLFGWMMRRACYVREQPSLAAAGGAVYTLFTLGGLFVLHQMEYLTVASAFGVLGAASLASGVWLATQLDFSWTAFGDKVLVRRVLRDHWRYGRWAMAARVPMRAPGSFIIFALPIWGGLAATGAYKAMSVLILPASQIAAALSAVMIPKFVRLRGTPEFARVVVLVLVLYVVCSATYGLLLAVFREPVVRIVFHGRYGEYTYLLWFFAGYPLFASAAEVFSATLQSIERTDWLFWAHTISGGVTVAVTLGLIVTMGVKGAAIGFLIGGVAAFACTGYYYVRYQMDQIRANEAGPKRTSQPIGESPAQAAEGVLIAD